MSTQPKALRLVMRIMNIPTPALLTFQHDEAPALIYKRGHRDARHAAADIATEAEETIARLHAVNAELLEALKKMHTAATAMQTFWGSVCASQRWHPEYAIEATLFRVAIHATAAAIQKAGEQA